MRILVVDDSEDSRDIAEAALMSAGYEDIVTVGSAWDAFRVMELGRPGNGGLPNVDIVLLDIVMPEIDGIEACARIRTDQRYADTPILMVTSLADMDSLANAFVAGANDYITKPVNRIELLARVRAALKLKGELERRRARERELLNFLSSWGDRRASVWIDQATGLFVGEVAEAYLAAADGQDGGETISALALTVDRFDAYRSGHGENASRDILARVAHQVCSTVATVGVIAASYRNGLILLVAPQLDAATAKQLGETLRAGISQLAIGNREAIAADHVTASVAVVTGRMSAGIDRMRLLALAISTVKDATEAGGNRVVAAGI